MLKYLDLLRDVIAFGVDKSDRTGTGTRSVFGRQVRFDLNEGFPILTTKKVNFKGVVVELLWFLRGSTNVRWLHDSGVHIWDQWTDEDGWLGPIYGAQWRRWACPSGHDIDQMHELIDLIKTKPDSRRLLVSAWNPADLPDESLSPATNVRQGKMSLAPCHCLVQFYVAKGALSCQLYQRSADLFLGVPFNIASYALLTHLIAKQCGLGVGEFIHTFGDLHLYNNHLTEEIVYKQLLRQPETLPRLVIKDEVPSLFDYATEDISLEGYSPQPAIKAPISV